MARVRRSQRTTRARRAFVALVAAGLVASLLGGCGGSDGSTLLMADGVEREQPRGDAPVAATVDGVSRFGYDLFQAAAEPDENTVLSPLSVAYAFAMARAGANGETAAQMDEVFGFPADVHGAFNGLSREIVTVEGPPPPKPAKREAGKTVPPVVAIANGMFLQKDFAVRDAFLRTLAAQYGAGVRVVDFTAGNAAEAALDRWADEQTAGRIKRVFDDIERETKLVLANAVYFRADWKEQFHNVTDGQTFTRTDGSTVKTALMNNLAIMNYAASDGWQAVELPYAGDAFAMWVLVPTSAVVGAEPGRLLAPATLAAVAGGLTPTSVEVHLPRWNFETRPDLPAALASLGLTAPFDAGADFSGISSGLFIGQAMHAANITVDEWGTEAAAITAVAMPASGPPPVEVVIRADRPFAFAIMHLPTRTPLFIGQVTDPTKT
jgi:serine protease inhibitor